MNDLLTAAQAAERLRLSRRQIHRLAENGTLPEAHRSPGTTGARLFRRADVEALAITRSHQTAVVVGGHAADGLVVVEGGDLANVVRDHTEAAS